MYAVIRTGGKQYRVSEGSTIYVEKLEGNPGSTLELVDVLLVANGDDVKVGSPVLAGAKVLCEVVEHRRADKLVVFKFKRRKRYRRRNGHRQALTTLKITGISV